MALFASNRIGFLRIHIGSPALQLRTNQFTFLPVSAENHESSYGNYCLVGFSLRLHQRFSPNRKKKHVRAKLSPGLCPCA